METDAGSWSSIWQRFWRIASVWRKHGEIGVCRRCELWVWLECHDCTPAFIDFINHIADERFNWKTCNCYDHRMERRRYEQAEREERAKEQAEQEKREARKKQHERYYRAMLELRSSATLGKIQDVIYVPDVGTCSVCHCKSCEHEACVRYDDVVRAELKKAFRIGQSPPSMVLLGEKGPELLFPTKIYPVPPVPPMNLVNAGVYTVDEIRATSSNTQQLRLPWNNPKYQNIVAAEESERMGDYGWKTDEDRLKYIAPPKPLDNLVCR